MFRPEALAVLEQVRARGLRLGVLSDCTIELAEAWQGLPVAGLVDARVLSCEAGRTKPDPVLFTTIARQLGVAPADCLYVGDGGGRELSGASACGMHAVMLRAADWSTSAAHAREDDWAGPWVPSLSAVLPLLHGPAGRTARRPPATGQADPRAYTPARADDACGAAPGAPAASQPERDP